MHPSLSLSRVCVLRSNKRDDTRQTDSIKEEREREGKCETREEERKVEGEKCKKSERPEIA